MTFTSLILEEEDGSISVPTAELISRQIDRKVNVQVVDLAADTSVQSSTVDVELVRDLKVARREIAILIIASAGMEHWPDLGLSVAAG